MAKLPRAFGGAPRVDRYEGTTCAEPDCNRQCRALSRWCTRHASIHYRTRSPNGRLPRKGELRPFRDLAEHALDQWGMGSHAAVLAAETSLVEMIRRHERYPEPWRGHMRRLFHEGATGRELLLAILSVYGLREIGHPNAFGGGGLDDAVFWTSLGSRVLRVKPLGHFTHAITGRKEQARIPGHVAESFGRALASRLGALPLVLWRRIEEERRREEGAAVKAALRESPL